MPREIPELSTEFSNKISRYLKMIDDLEDLRFHVEQGYIHKLSIQKLEHYYELTYLRSFVLWEKFLENCCFRFMCGYSFRGVSAVPVRPFCNNIASAENTFLNGQSYFLWHNPSKVVTRTSLYIQSSSLQNVISSAITTLEDYASIRHRIAHGQTDSINKFDVVTLRYSGKKYPGSSAGKYLRDSNYAQIPKKRLHTICDDLISLSMQIAN